MEYYYTKKERDAIHGVQMAGTQYTTYMAPQDNQKANDFQVDGDHYQSKVQHWDYVIANKIPYLEAMVIKYLARWRKKGGHVDVKKAYHFLLKLAETEGIDLSPDGCSKRGYAGATEPARDAEPVRERRVSSNWDGP